METESVLVNNPTSNIKLMQEVLNGYKPEMYNLSARYHPEYGTDYIKQCVEKLQYIVGIYRQCRDELK